MKNYLFCDMITINWISSMIIRIYNRYINNVRKYISMLKADKYSWEWDKQNETSGDNICIM